jgi:hypothetical protein
MDSTLWWRGVIRRTDSGSPIYIHAQRPTAEFYGWAEAFDARRAAVAIAPRPDGRHFARAGSDSPFWGGRPMRISRAASKHSQVPGASNRFRIARQATNADIALVAAATKVEWCWMTDKKGKRVDRAIWLG